MESTHFEERLSEMASALAASIREAIVSGNRQLLVDAFFIHRNADLRVEEEALEAFNLYREISSDLARFTDDGGD